MKGQKKDSGHNNIIYRKTHLDTVSKIIQEAKTL